MIEVPEEGRPSQSISAASLIGIDGNAFSIMGVTKTLLKKEGASEDYIDAYLKEAMSGDYDHLIQASVAYLDPYD